MNIHEYQAKQILARYNVNVPKGAIALDKNEIDGAISKLSSAILVVKAQIHAGGRGKAGGVKVCKNKDDAKREANEMFGKTLVTHQTGPKGQMIRRVYIEEGSNIKKEYYLSLVLDRETSGVSIIASAEGGMEIEEIAHTNPEKILTLAIGSSYGIKAFHARYIATFLGFDKETTKNFIPFLSNLYKAFIETDASQIEINPLVLTAEGSIVALDAKFGFDDNALFRHADIVELKDEHEEDPLERRAQEASLNYITLDGNIGCMVNGAGLAMATMDIIKLYGGEPANFLDVGGGATKERVTEAFKIILSDTNVKGILVNIFGGIMRCDIIAEGVIAAAKEVSLEVPLVVRLAGTNVDLGKQLLGNSGLKIIPADDLDDAADKIVKAIGVK